MSGRTSSLPVWSPLLVSLLLLGAAGGELGGAGWLAGLRNLLQDCPARPAGARGFVAALGECVRRRAWLAIDRMLEDDVVPLADGFELVRLKGPGQPAVSGAMHHSRKSVEQVLDKGRSESIDDVDWREKLSSRLARVLRTHVIKIDVDRLQADLNDTAGRSSYGQLEGRGRRRRKRQMNMMPIVMMGMLLMGSVLVPMGFQFLAVLGGKALILAKMALMMSSIQGLKKIATSGVNYGLYHTGIPEPWHERSGHLDLPLDAPYHGQGEVSSAPGPYFGPHYVRRTAVQPT